MKFTSQSEYLLCARTQMTASVYAAIATPRICHSEGVISAILHRYRDRTATRVSDFLQLWRRCSLSLTDCITAAERQNHRLDRESNGEEVLGARVLLLQVDDFRTAAVGEVTG